MPFPLIPIALGALRAAPTVARAAKATGGAHRAAGAARVTGGGSAGAHAAAKAASPMISPVAAGSIGYGVASGGGGDQFSNVAQQTYQPPSAAEQARLVSPYQFGPRL